MINKIFAGSRMSFTLCGVTAVLLVGFLPAVARDQCPESEPTEETPEAAIEPTPLPGYGNTLRATIAPPRKRHCQDLHPLEGADFCEAISAIYLTARY